MYLSRLEIFGFKTFAQKIDLHFDDGITNIVGPNGCGKSNIVDALRWALGEQKSSVLRSEKMENVIFNGTKSRKPLNLAEVSLTIHNTKNVLPTEYTEVTITRRLYRSGESEYYLNRLPCRLKDINDLFMDTGMGADAYSVIELKMVEQILSDNAEDRRKLFEEAAGITKYKIRRRQTFRKLETTKQDLMRVNDIVTEIEKKVNSLKRQTQKANRYQRLMAELKREEVRLGLYQYGRLNEQIAPLTEQLANLESVADRMLGETSLKESEAEKVRAHLISREQTLREIQLRLESHDKRLKDVEEVILVSRERKTYLLDLIRRYSDEKNTLSERRENLRVQIGALTTTVSELEARSRELEADLERRRSDLASADETIEADRKLLDDTRRRSVQLIDDIARKHSSYQVTRNSIENLEKRVEDLLRESREHESQTGDTLHALDQHEERRRQSAASIGRLQESLASTQADLELHRRQVEDLRTQKLQAEADIKSLDARAAILQKAIETHEGFPESVQFLLDRRSQEFKYTVADLMSSDDRYKKALEAALGDCFSYLVASNPEAVREAISLLNEQGRGSATFVHSARLGATGTPAVEAAGALSNEVLGSALQLARCEDSALARWLLGDVLIVEDLATAMKLADRLPHLRFVTLAGELVKGNYLIKGGGRSRTADSIIGQRENLRRLMDRRQHLEEQTVRLSKQIVDAETLVQTDQAELAAGQSALRQLEQDLMELEKEISQQEYEQKRSQDTVARNLSTIEQTRAEIESLQNTLNRIAPEVDALERQRQDLELQVRQHEHRLIEQDKSRKEKADQVHECLSAALRLEGELKNHRHTIESSERQIVEYQETADKHESESRQAVEEIARIDEHIRAKETELVELNQSRTSIERERDAQETDVAQFREAASKLEADLRKMRRQREDLLNSRHALEQQHNDLRFEVRSLTERILREYDFDLARDAFESLDAAAGIPVDDDEPAETDSAPAPASSDEPNVRPVDEVLGEERSVEQPTDRFDATAAQEAIENLRRKIKMLGPVNMEAYSEYQAEKERLDVLTRQRQDLLEAEGQLMQTIDTINQTAQRQFMDVFEQIRQNFIKIFASLFVDGEANLQLAEEQDPLEAPIDILARPTGKKIQYIALLSGGEKTLTAIALLFAIYLVKPSPFCILDEVDAPLDDTNIDKFTKILRDFSQDTQFIVVTHNKRTMEAASNIFGITMQEAGVSKVVSVKFNSRDEKNRSDDIEEIIRRNQVEVLSQDVKEPPPEKSAEA